MKKGIASLLCILVICSCGKNQDTLKKVSQLPENKQNSDSIAEKQNANIFTITNGINLANISVPDINNKIMGIEDEFYTTSVIENAKLVPLFKGFAIYLPPDINIKNGIKVIAQYKDNVFSESSKINEFENKSVDKGFYQYYTFENKFWINPTGKWNIKVYNGDKLLLSTSYTDKTSMLFYKTEENTPFKSISERHIVRGNNYTYRYLSDHEMVVVIYFSSDAFVFSPITVLSSTSLSADKKIDIKWNENSKSGFYYIKAYYKKNIPSKTETIPLFESFTLE